MKVLNTYIVVDQLGNLCRLYQTAAWWYLEVFLGFPADYVGLRAISNDEAMRLTDQVTTATNHYLNP